MKRERFFHNLRNKKNILLQVVLVNFLYLVILLLLFEPTAKSDDYDIANLLYGGVDGQYSQFLLYSNVLWGYLLKGLMLLLPNISWYYVLQYILMYCAFCTIYYVFYKKNTKDIAQLLFLIFMIFAGYEFYIRITFSKTSGLLIAAGYVFLLFLIDSGKARVLQWFWGCLLIFIGILIRNEMLKGITLIFFSAFIIFCYKKIIKKDDKFKKQIFQFVLIVSFLFLVSIISGKLNEFLYNSDKIWGEYISENRARATLVDLGIPDYDFYEEEYKELGVSKNDYTMWFSLANRCDPDILDSEMYGQISNIRESDVLEDVPKIERIRNAFYGLVKYHVANTMFYLLLAAVFLFLFIQKKLFIFIVPCVSSFCVLAYLYLSYLGRIQHHVDASIYMTGAIIILYYIETNNEECKVNPKLVILSISLIFIMFINYFYSGFISSSYYATAYGKIDSQKEQFQENLTRLSLLSEDEEHLYVISAYETNRIYPCFTVFEPIKKNFYHNIYRTNMNHIPVFENVLKDFGVKNIWNEITNNNDMSYVVSKSCLSEIPIIQTYIQEHYSSNAKSVLVKQVEDMYIYRFIDDTFTIDVSQVQDNSQVIHTVEKVYDEAGNVILDGYAFIEGKDSYAQNIYIQAVNKKTGEYKIFTCLQTENAEFRNGDKYSGKYSAFSATIDRESLKVAKLKKKNVEFNLLLEVDGEIYQIPIE